MTFRSVLVTRSYEQVVEQILERVQAGEFAPGQRLPTERELGELFGVSRGVIREAIKVLSAMGLVESRQGSGTYVAANIVPSVSRALVLSAKPDAHSLIPLMEFRAPLETLAARLAARTRGDEEVAPIRAAAEATAAAASAGDVPAFARADDEFHGLLYHAARNPYLQTVLMAVREVQQKTVALVVPITGSMTAAGAAHRRIAEAVAAHDEVGAAAVMAEHIADTTAAVRETMAADESPAAGPAAAL